MKENSNVIRTAHKKNAVEDISAIITKTKSDAELLELAIERNAKHGLQLSLDDKEGMAIKIWLGTPAKEQAAKETELQRILSVGAKQIQRFLSRTKKEKKESARKQAFSMWLACATQQEISSELVLDQGTVSNWIESFMNFGQMSEFHKTQANHADESFQAPIYNIRR